MTAVITEPIALLRLEAIRDILSSAGPCITMLLPPHHPGEPAGSSLARIKADIQAAMQHLVARRFPKSEAEDLLSPLERLTDGSRFVSGSHYGHAIFCSHDVFQQFQLTQPVPAALSVASSFSIRKLAHELALPRLFYILELSKDRIAALECRGLHAAPIQLPGVPETLVEALDLDAPDHNLEGYSSIGSSTGNMHSIRFGMGSARESRHAHLADYYRMVDRRLQELLNEPETPLILAGVEEDLALYRSVSGYRSLVKHGIPGSPGVARDPTEMWQRAGAILRQEAIERDAAALVAELEKTAPNRFSTDPNTILEAAFDGRISHLFIDEHGERMGEFARGVHKSLGEEDLLNPAMVQTILHHGKACELPSDRMPKGSIAVGIMRF